MITAGIIIAAIVGGVAATRSGHGALDEMEREHDGSQW